MPATAFGAPIERLHAIGARHVASLTLSEVVGLTSVANDPTIDPVEMEAFIRFRAIAALMAACHGDVALFERVLSQARDLARRGLLL
ncbi:hypothetical protein [Sphingomonas adhaesiva]|uniref:hypothetical protein n=1 Tax=Sphingomonas adhaesiva TaxID=28212 RepID=UPI002FFB216F